MRVFGILSAYWLGNLNVSFLWVIVVVIRRLVLFLLFDASMSFVLRIVIPCISKNDQS